MSRVAIPITVLSRDPAGITPPTQTDGDATRLHSLVNNGSTWLEVQNTDSSSHTVDFPQVAVDDVTPVKTLTVPASSTRLFGPIPSVYYNQGVIAADQTLTSDGTAPSNNDTVTIAGQVYTFKTTLSSGGTVPNEVLIGANAAAALTNLKQAINASTGAGTQYGTGTAANLYVTATTLTSTTLLVVAQIAGSGGNSYGSTETSSHLSFGAATLQGGYDSGAVCYVNPSVSTLLKFRAYSLV
jgi:hypothetical protein